MKLFYSKIPHRIFRIEVEGAVGTSLIKELKEPKLGLIFHNLYISQGFDGKLRFTVSTLIEQCGFAVSKGMIKTFMNALGKLQDAGYIMYSRDLRTIKKNDHIICEFAGLDFDTHYTMIYQFEVDTIIANKAGIAHDEVFNLYAHIKGRINIDYDASKYASKPNTCYPSIKTMSEMLDISEPSIHKYLPKLSEINLLRYDNVGYFVSKGGAVKHCSNIYALYTNIKVGAVDAEYDYEFHIKEGKKMYLNYYKGNDKHFEYGELQGTAQQLGGKVSSIKRKIDKGTATDADIVELETITIQLKMLGNKNLQIDSWDLSDELNEHFKEAVEPAVIDVEIPTAKPLQYNVENIKSRMASKRNKFIKKKLENITQIDATAPRLRRF